MSGPKLQTEALVKAAVSIVESAHREGEEVRISGGLGSWLHCPGGRHKLLMRTRFHNDIDLVVHSSSRHWLRQHLIATGWKLDPGYEAPFRRRDIYYRLNDNVRCDVYVGGVEGSHMIFSENRLGVDFPTLPVTELLLEKLQNREADGKDFLDMGMLLSEHEVEEEDDEEAVNLTVFCQHTCTGVSGWGLSQSARLNFEKLIQFMSSEVGISVKIRQIINERCAILLHRMDSEKKNWLWRLRAIPGDRLRYYRIAEETPPGNRPVQITQQTVAKET